MKDKITLLVGVPGSGKTWITKQVEGKYDLCHHDAWIGDAKNPSDYVERIINTAKDAKKPVLAEAPFSISKIKDPLEEAGYKVECVYIIEHPATLVTRYWDRENREIPKGHLTRMNTYAARAKAANAFSGTSTQVLEYLNSKVQ